MWKRLLIGMITLIGTFSFVYAMDQNMNANEVILGVSDYNKLRKYDKVTLGTDTTGVEQLWDVNVVDSKFYTISKQVGSSKLCTKTTDNFTTASGVVSGCSFAGNTPTSEKSPIYTLYLQYESAFASSIQNNSFENSSISNLSGNSGVTVRCTIPTSTQFNIGGLFGISSLTDIIGDDFVAGSLVHSSPAAETSTLMTGKISNTASKIAYVSKNTELPRWFSYYDINGSASGILDVTANLRVFTRIETPNSILLAIDGNLSPNTRYTVSSLPRSDMKLRYRDDSMLIRFEKMSYQNKDITKIVENKSIHLEFSSDSTASNQKTTALIFDSSGANLLYYIMIADTSSESADLDLTGIPRGSYQIALMNEVYESNSKRPAAAHISPMKSLEIVAPPTAVYTTNVSSAIYGENKIKQGSTIGSLLVTGGVGPYTYEIDSNMSSNFKVSDTVNPDGSLDIQIVSDLKAGTYNFKVKITDFNDVSTEVNIVLDVEKTKPTLSFSDSKQVDLKIGQTADKTGVISFTNTDASFIPKLTMTSDKGDASLLTVQLDPNDHTKYIVTPASSYAGTSLPASYTLTLSGEGTENFIAPDSVTKTYYLYKELSGLEWNAVSSSINVNDVATSGVTVGTLLAKDGYPDYKYEIIPISDSAYDPTTGADNSSFVLDVSKASYGTKVNVKTTGKLTAKQYYLQFRVTDQKGASKIQTGTFTVTANAQSALSFYDKQGGSKISSLSVAYGDKSKKLYAEGGSTTKAILYGFAPSDQQPSDLKGSAQDYANINASTGEITPLKVGTIKVMATRPGDDTHSAISVTMDLTITDGEQTISFNSTIPKKKAFKENEEINIPATLTRDDQTSGDIKYISETESVCIVEDETVAKVKMLTIGNCSVKAYNDDDNYKKAEDHVIIQLYEGIQSVFTPKANVKQGDQSTKADDPTGLASITLSKGDGTYTLVSMTVKKDGVTQSSLFELTGSDSKWKIIPKQDAGYGTYDVTIKFKDGEKAETEVTGTITIGLQENKDFILTYDGSKAASISKDYQSVKTNGIQLDTKGNLGNGTIVYAPAAANTKDPNESVDAVEINSVTGLITVNRVTTSNDHYEFYAYIAEDTSSGYAKQETQKVTVTITASKQSISFTDSKGNTITEISETYAQTPNDTFQLYTKKLGTGTVTYQLKDTSSTTLVKVSDTGVVTILKATSITAPETVIIVATVEAKDGYESKSVEIPVTIKQASQTIKWKNENDSFVVFDEATGFSTTKETAILDRDDQTTGSIAYESENTDVCTIDSNGNIKGLKEGACSIKAKNTDTNYTKAEISKTVTFYTGLSAKFTQAKKQLQAGSSKANAIAGTIDVTGGTADSEFVYSIHDGEADLFTFSDETYGVLSLARDLSIDDLKGISYNSTKGGYPIKVKVDITDQATNVVKELECEVIVKGAAQTTVGFNDGKGNKTDKIEKVYSEDGTFSLGLLDNLGGTPTYTLKTNSPEDVIEVTGNIITILNANDQANDSRTVIVQAVIAAKNGYDAKTIECEVEITKAEQTTFKFSSSKITMLPDSNTIPVLTGGIPLDESKGEGIITLSSDAQNIVSVDPQDPSKIQSHDEGTAKLTAIITGNRNYKAGKAETTVVVTTAPAYAFKISVPTATYGDTQEIKGSVIAGSTPPSGDGIVTRTWTSSNQDVATIDKDGIITIKNAGTTTIKCVQESTKDDAVSDSVTFTVKPKPITVTLEDKEISMGEKLPEFTYTVQDEEILDQDLATFLAPAFRCVDKAGAAVSETTKPGTYTINAVYDTTELPYKNYKITIKPATLTIGQDASQSTWLALIGHDTKKTLNSKDWHKEAVDITINKTISAPYDEISIDETTWTESILIANEGNQELTVYFRNSTTLSQATAQKVTVKIDHTEPEIESISGVPVKQNVLEKTINKLTYGTWFKPNDQLTIKAKDTDKPTVNEISGLSQLHYIVYELDEKQAVSDPPYMDQTVPMTTATKTFKLTNPGQYRICAVVTDQAGNESAEYCSDVHIKKINVDADDDDIPDFNDTNDDGCPDLNIVLGTDQAGNKVKLNVAEKDKNYPYMNIDSNGDGKADLNIDTDRDDKPDLNLVIMSESLWEPKLCVLKEQVTAYSEPNEYCTGTNAKPIINVDTTGNNIPNINIDTDGDMKADFNIDINNDGEPDLNIGKVPSKWMPDQDYKYEGFQYDTMNDLEPLTNMGIIDDRYPSINIDLDQDGVPDLNIDVNGDGIPDINIDGNGAGKPNINVDTDKNGTPDEYIVDIKEWNPKKLVNGNIVYMTEEIVYEEPLQGNKELEDQGIIVEKSDGTFLPNFAIKVEDVTSTKKEEVETEASKQLEETQEIKTVYDVKLLENDVEVQPDGALKVRIPIPEGIKNPKLLVKRSDGTYETAIAKEENGYLVYETNELGIVSVIGDKQETPKPTPDPQPSTDSNKEKPVTSKPMTQDTYTADTGIGRNMGGAITGDTTNLLYYMIGIVGALYIMTILKSNVNK